MDWTIVEGINRLDEEEKRIAARSSDDGMYFAYMAYSGVKVVELLGIDNVGKISDSGMDESKVEEKLTGDHEVALPIIIGDNNVVVAITGLDELVPISDVTITTLPEVAFTEIYELEEWEFANELFSDAPFLAGLSDVLDII